ncbi:ANR50 protein, partial [Acromyrmex insinuator]
MAAPVIEKKRFFCREWAFTKLSHCLEQRPQSKTCGALIVSGPGSGKTALCAELAWPSSGASARHQRSLNRRLLARHFCQARSEASLSPAQFVRSLVAQLLQASSDGSQHRASSTPISPATSANAATTTVTTTMLTTTATATTTTTTMAVAMPTTTTPTTTTTTTTTIVATAPPLTSREAVAEAYAEKLRTDPEIQAALQPDVLDREGSAFPAVGSRAAKELSLLASGLY